MKTYKQFILEVYRVLSEDKADDYGNRYLKVHADHPLVQQDRTSAKKLIQHAQRFAKDHDESIFVTRGLLDRVYKPGEDDPTIRNILGRWRSAKNRKQIDGNLANHTHNTASALLKDIPELTVSKGHANALQGLRKYHIGEIDHPKYGRLTVSHIIDKNIDDKEFKEISSNIRKSCTRSSWCVINDPEYLKHYSKGGGFLYIPIRNPAIMF